MNSDPLTTYYLEITDRQAIKAKSLDREKYRVLERTGEGPAFNQCMYRMVGEQWAWHDKRDWNLRQWQAYLTEQGARSWLLADRNGGECGYFELSTARLPEVDILYFGLLPIAIGQDLGNAWLGEALCTAFDIGAKRVKVNTCSLDHPAALKNYQARGMQLYRTTMEPSDV